MKLLGKLPDAIIANVCSKKEKYIYSTYLDVGIHKEKDLISMITQYINVLLEDNSVFFI